MWKCRFFVLAILVLFAFGIGCSGGNNIEGPVGPANEGQPAGSISGTMAPSNPVVPGNGDQPLVAVPSGTTSMLGLWEVTIDKEAGTIEAVDMRTSSLIINVLGFLEPPPLTGMTIDFGTLVLDDPIVEVDVIVSHPLPDAIFTGFDVRGVVFGPEVEFADGLTIIPSPEFFKGVPFGYKDGILGAPDSYAHYTGLAGYKYFCDGLAKHGDLVTFMSDPVNLAKRGVFSPKPQKNTRHYVLRWSGSSLGFMVFNYAIYANYNWPTGAAPYDISDFDISTANSAEAFCAKVTETANTLWYSSGGGGGAISMDVEVWDWQGNVANVSVQSIDPGVIAESFFDVFVEVSPYHDTFKFIDVPGTPTAVGDLDLLITATDPVTFGNAWLMGMLPTTNPMYQKPVYNCWKYTIKVSSCPKPNPTGILPGSHAPDSALFSAILNGTNFVGGPSLAVKLKKTGQTDIAATNVAFVSATLITCDITIPLNTALGLWDIEVMNGCGVPGTGVGIFEVICPKPTVTKITPNAHVADGIAFSGYINGTNFVNGSNLAAQLVLGAITIPITGLTVPSSTQINFSSLTIIAGSIPGTWDVQVINGCDKTAIGTGAKLFTVTLPVVWTPSAVHLGTYTKARDCKPTNIIDSHSSYESSGTFAVSGAAASGGSGGPYTYYWGISNSSSVAPTSWTSFTYAPPGPTNVIVDWSLYTSMAPCPVYFWGRAFDGANYTTAQMMGAKLTLSKMRYETPSSNPFSTSWWAVESAGGGSITFTNSSGTLGYGYHSSAGTVATDYHREWRYNMLAIPYVNFGTTGRNTMEFYVDVKAAPWSSSGLTKSSYMALQSGSTSDPITWVSHGTWAGDGAPAGIQTVSISKYAGNRYIGIYAYTAEDKGTFTWTYDDLAVYEDP
jgi:hypothetical protein